MFNKTEATKWTSFLNKTPMYNEFYNQSKSYGLGFYKSTNKPSKLWFALPDNLIKRTNMGLIVPEKIHHRLQRSQSEEEKGSGFIKNEKEFIKKTPLHIYGYDIADKNHQFYFYADKENKELIKLVSDNGFGDLVPSMEYFNYAIKTDEHFNIIKRSIYLSKIKLATSFPILIKNSLINSISTALEEYVKKFPNAPSYVSFRSYGNNQIKELSINFKVDSKDKIDPM